MKIDAATITALLAQLVALAALAAAVVVVCKAAGIVIPVKGSLQDWTYVAVACAAARMARA